MSGGFKRPVLAASGMALIPTTWAKEPTTMLHAQKQQYYGGGARANSAIGRGKWWFPGKGNQPIDSDYMKEKVFWTKGRDQWDYNKINESVTKQSTFGSFEERTDFGRDSKSAFEKGPRDYDYQDMQKGMFKNPTKNVKQLHEYFDEYTQPGVNEKMAAAEAVKEHWDSENFYYPGESWKRNRPAFRSVPKEVLNKETWYSLIHLVSNWEKVPTMLRPRAFNPRWPPPGFRLPKYPERKDMYIGLDHPEIVHELERHYWYMMWRVRNFRMGGGDLLWWLLIIYVFYYSMRNCAMEHQMMKMMQNLMRLDLGGR